MAIFLFLFEKNVCPQVKGPSILARGHTTEEKIIHGTFRTDI
jgi:hypothetical protein